MILRPSLFWDTDITTVDLVKHKKAIVERVLLRGTHEEFKALIKYYGMDAVKQIALNARYLDKVTLAFCCALFDKTKTDFRCYTWQQSNPTHWDY